MVRDPSSSLSRVLQVASHLLVAAVVIRRRDVSQEPLDLHYIEAGLVHSQHDDTEPTNDKTATRFRL